MYIFIYTHTYILTHSDLCVWAPWTQCCKQLLKAPETFRPTQCYLRVQVARQIPMGRRMLLTLLPRAQHLLGTRGPRVGPRTNDM